MDECTPEGIQGWTLDIIRVLPAPTFPNTDRLWPEWGLKSTDIPESRRGAGCSVWKCRDHKGNGLLVPCWVSSHQAGCRTWRGLCRVLSGMLNINQLLPASLSLAASSS